MEFSIHRLISLIRLDWTLYSRKYIWSGIAGLLLLGAIMLIIAQDRASSAISPVMVKDFYPFYAILFGLGSVAILLNFNNLASHYGRSMYLSLPASHFEKFLSHWLYTLVVLPTTLIALYFIGYQIFGYLSSILFNVEFSSFRLFVNDDEFQVLWPWWLMLHSILFLFSIMYQKYTIFKAFGSIFIIVLVLSFVAYICIRLVMWEHFDGLSMTADDNLHVQPSEHVVDLLGERIGPILLNMLYFVWPIWLWVIAYLKLSEKEA